MSLKELLAAVAAAIPVSAINIRAKLGYCRLKILLSSLDACAAASHRFFDLGEGRHRRISRRRHRQRAVRGAALDCPLWAFVGEKPVNEAGSERVAASDAIENLEVFPHLSLVVLPVDEAN